MYISRLMIQGFHSLQNVSINFFPGLNVLIGKNNSGKSNIIKALDCILGEKYPSYLEFEDRCFYRDPKGNSSYQFTIIAKLSGGGIDSDRIETPTKKIKIYSYKNSPSEDIENLHTWIEDVCSQTEERPWPSYAEIVERLETAVVVYLYLIVPKQSKKGNRDYGLIFKSKGWWWCCPVLSGDLRDALLTTAYIPAFRDPAQQLRLNQYSWFGKLIKNIYSNRTESQRQKILKAQEEQSTVLDDIFKETTRDLRKRLSQVVFHNRISFQSGANTLDDEYKQITMFVDDGLDTPYYEKGSGIQSALIIGLFSFYCQQFHKGSSLLLVEEPEIYLHPQARRVIEAQLNQFVDEEIKKDKDTGDLLYGRQVIISTHSPEFLRSVPISNICLVKKVPGSNGSSVKQYDVEDPRSRQIIETKNAEMFFADHVILVEGGEEYILPPLADVIINNGEKRWLDAYNISIARVNGKGQFEAYASLLDNFGIKWTVLTDLDFLMDGIDHFSEKLDQLSRDNLAKICQCWSQVASKRKLRGRQIKERVFEPNTRDWVNLYHQVDDLITQIASGNNLASEELRNAQALWEKLRDRVVQKVDISELFKECGNEIDNLLDYLRTQNIYVLPKGELEDHLPEEALLELGKIGKDRSALEFSKMLSIPNMREQWVDEWLNSDSVLPFKDLLVHIEKVIHPNKIRDDIQTTTTEVEIPS